jgi:hypothetical protein
MWRARKFLGVILCLGILCQADDFGLDGDFGSSYSKPIFDALDENDLGAIADIIANDSEALESRYDACDNCFPGRITPLMYAANKGRLEAVRLLLKLGAEVHATSADGNAVTMACSSAQELESRIEVLRILHAAGADIDYGPTGWPPIFAALFYQRGDFRLVDTLLELGAQETVFVSAGRGDIASVAAILEAGYSADHESPSGSLLEWAVYSGNLELVQMLVAAGATLQCDQPFTPFWWAQYLASTHPDRYLPIVRELLDHGAVMTGRGALRQHTIVLRRGRALLELMLERDYELEQPALDPIMERLMWPWRSGDDRELVEFAAYLRSIGARSGRFTFSPEGLTLVRLLNHDPKEWTDTRGSIQQGLDKIVAYSRTVDPTGRGIPLRIHGDAPIDRMVDMLTGGSLIEQIAAVVSYQHAGEVTVSEEAVHIWPQGHGRGPQVSAIQLTREQLAKMPAAENDVDRVLAFCADMGIKLGEDARLHVDAGDSVLHILAEDIAALRAACEALAPQQPALQFGQ